MTDLEKIEEMVRRNPSADQIQTMLKKADLKKLGLQEFDGKFTHLVQIKDFWKTVEVLPRKSK